MNGENQKVTLLKFVDKLPIIKTLKPKGVMNGVPYYEIRMQQFKKKLHRDLPETTVWGFERNFPGPTIETNRNECIKVKWMNDLPEKHLLPVDTTVHGAEANNLESEQ
jgi:spore coat protein A